MFVIIAKRIRKITMHSSLMIFLIGWVLLFFYTLCSPYQRASSFNSMASTSLPNGVDGELKDYCMENDCKIRKAANSVVLIVDSSLLLKISNSSYLLNTKTAGQVWNLCANDPYSQQQTIPNMLAQIPTLFSELIKDDPKYSKFGDLTKFRGFCSGVLITNNLIATAGHCLSLYEGDDFMVNNLSVVFGYRYGDKVECKAQAPQSMNCDGFGFIPSNHVYKLGQIVWKPFDPKNPNTIDLAVVKLKDGPVSSQIVNIQAVTGFRDIQAMPLNSSDQVYSIGYPLGLPQKISAKSRVIAGASSPKSFQAYLNSFGGSSGSAVFDNDNKLVGIVADVSPKSLYEFKQPNSNCSSLVKAFCRNTSERADCELTTAFYYNNNLLPQ